MIRLGDRDSGVQDQNFRPSVARQPELHQEYAFARCLRVKQVIRLFRLVERELVSEKRVDIDLAIGDELRTVRLSVLAESP